jgi:hypothetical protein
LYILGGSRKIIDAYILKKDVFFHNSCKALACSFGSP